MIVVHHVVSKRAGVAERVRKDATLTVDDSSHAVLEDLDLLRVHLECSIECETCRVRSLHRLLSFELDGRAFLVDAHD